MSSTQFCDQPWQKSHVGHLESILNIRPAPEFATAEVMVASLYRTMGFEGHAERAVPTAGREFDKASRKAKAPESCISQEAWRTVLHGVLESPKQPNQSSKRFLQLCPVIPSTALYSGSPRLTGNSWTPGVLLQRMIQMGSSDSGAANSLWERLFNALSVDQDDDIWARWLSEEFERRKTVGLTWRLGEASLVVESHGFPNVSAELVERVKALPQHHCLFKSAQYPGEVIQGTPFYALP
jgi:hypothetical protein